MNKPSETPTPVERAERILSRRQAAADQEEPGQEEPGSVERAEAQVGRLGQSVGHGLLRAAARGYVAAALKTQEVTDAVGRAWQQSVEQAHREREEQTARTEGAAAARQEAAEEKRGEKTLRKAFGDAEEAADAAGEAAEA